jgi:hypothetical protein
MIEENKDQRPLHDEPSPDSLEWARLRFERQKLALEMRARLREISAQRNQSVWRALLANPISVAIVGGILTLTTSVVTSVVTSFLTARANLEAEQSRAELARRGSQQALQADLIKKFVEGARVETVRGNLQFLADTGLIPDYAASIQNYLATNPGAPQVGGQFEFSPAGEAVSAVLQQQLRDKLGQFRTYLVSIGFSNLDDNISVFIFSKDHPIPIPNISSEEPNSFYDQNTLYIHKILSGDQSIALREFTHYALKKAVGGDLFRQTAVESAIADYLPASFLKSPVVGLAFAKVKGSVQGFRTLDNKQVYDPAATKGYGGWFLRGIVWAGLLWACRNPEQPDGVDDLILPTWRKVSVLPLDEDLVEARFGSVLTAASPPQGACFTANIASRRLPVEK